MSLSWTPKWTTLQSEIVTVAPSYQGIKKDSPRSKNLWGMDSKFRSLLRTIMKIIRMNICMITNMGKAQVIQGVVLEVVLVL